MAYTTINKPSQYFNTKLYTGNGNTTQSITGVGFQPDFSWVKNRSSGVAFHRLVDVIRGATKTLYSNSTIAESTADSNGYIASFDSDGLTVNLGSSGTGTGTNSSGDNFVTWNWLASNTTVSNTSGTISSTVSANTTAGFSIVSWTGDGSSSSTVGHGLGVKPGMIILKSRSFAATSYAWMVYQGSGAMNNNQNSVLNSTLAADGTSVTTQGQIYPPSVTSSVFGFASGSGGVAAVNGSSATNIAYCFSAIQGFSKFGSYTGNSSSDGTFVYTGFKPAFVMVKNINYSSGTDWFILDNKRNTYNVENLYLSPNTSGAEATGVDTDFLSNGFKLRHSSIAMNNSSYTYIYMAFAENPFVSSTQIPTTAR